MKPIKRQRASIVFYDEATGQIKICNVLRSKVQDLLDSSMSVAVPPEAPEHSEQPITNEDARQLGGMMILLQGYANPELRERLQITTAEQINWAPLKSSRDD